MGKGKHVCDWVLEYVGHREAEYRCSKCGEYTVTGRKTKEKSWSKDRKQARGKGSKYDV